MALHQGLSFHPEIQVSYQAVELHYATNKRVKLCTQMDPKCLCDRWLDHRFGKFFDHVKEPVKTLPEETSSV
jgi:pterin-4a-carbinolamine dehydratase